MLRCLFVVAFLVATVTLAAQESATILRFEVASIKRSNFRAGDRYLTTPGVAYPGGRWSAVNTTVARVVRTVYGVRAEQIIGAPSWFNSDLFVINAKAASTTASGSELIEMAKRLLAERFNLRLHIEQRPFEVHAMVLARRDRKLGSGMRPTTCEMQPEGRSASGAPPKSPEPPKRCGAFSQEIVDGVTRFHFSGHTLRTQLMLHRVEEVLGTPVIDRTGLTGLFDFDFQYVPDRLVWKSPGETNARSDPTLLAAMQSQLGLKFQRGRELLDVLVIDSVEYPTPD